MTPLQRAQHAHERTEHPDAYDDILKDWEFLDHFVENDQLSFNTKKHD